MWTDEVKVTCGGRDGRNVFIGPALTGTKMRVVRGLQPFEEFLSTGVVSVVCRRFQIRHVSCRWGINLHEVIGRENAVKATYCSVSENTNVYIHIIKRTSRA